MPTHAHYISTEGGRLLTHAPKDKKGRPKMSKPITITAEQFQAKVDELFENLHMCDHDDACDACQVTGAILVHLRAAIFPDVATID